MVVPTAAGGEAAPEGPATFHVVLWLGALTSPELHSVRRPEEAADLLATFAANAHRDPARYARAKAYVFEGTALRVTGDPPVLVTTAGPTPIPVPRRETVDAGPGWAPTP